MRWSESDNYFVSGSLKVFSVDLSSKPLKLVLEENIQYDGPKGDAFKSFLFDNGFRVNRQGKVIIRVPRRNDEEEYNAFLLEMVVQLGPYGFTNVPPPTQDVNVDVLRSLLDETRADLVKKNAMLDELQRKNVDWNSEQLLLTLGAITDSMNRIFVDFDLKPPASGDPKSVLVFFEKLRDLIRFKEEFGATFFVAANDILASIATTLYKSTGISIAGMETTRSTTPADLIKSLSTLRGFMVNRFFIDGSVMVKHFRLMNEKDIPVIFRDSEAGVPELHRKEIGAKSLHDIDGESIFYGYFNIPCVGKFKGILTRVNVTLPDEIMVKLRHQPNQLDEKKFWFVKANGEATFEKSLSPLESDIIKTGTISSGPRGGRAGDVAESVVVDSNLVFLGFLRRMNRTFVNKDGKYLKFEFITIKLSGLATEIDSNSIAYYDKGWVMIDPFSRVQFDERESPGAISEGRVSLPQRLSDTNKREDYFNDVLHRRLGNGHAFVFKNLCFVGNITEVSPIDVDFRKNAAVNAFFEQFQQPRQDCYVDAQGTTFFVYNPDKKKMLDNVNNRSCRYFEWLQYGEASSSKSGQIEAGTASSKQEQTVMGTASSNQEDPMVEKVGYMKGYMKAAISISHKEQHIKLLRELSEAINKINLDKMN